MNILEFAQPRSCDPGGLCVYEIDGSRKALNYHAAEGVDLAVNSFTTISASHCTSSTDLTCVFAVRDPVNHIVTYTIQSRASGWIGIGVGSLYMSGATMYIAYNNGKGGITLSQRAASGHVMPTASSVQEFTQLSEIPSYIELDPKASITVSFNRSLQGSSQTNPISLIGPTHHIYAYSSNRPRFPSNITSPISFHDHFGSFTLNLSNSSNNGSDSPASGLPGLSRDTLLTVHGVCMFLAWAVFAFVGIFTARYLKTRLGHNWYRLHVACAVGGTLLLSGAGLVAVQLSFAPGSGFSMNPIHKPIGVVIAFILLPLQIMLGYVSNALWSEDRMHIPWWDTVHWWLGRGMLILAVVEMYLGLELYVAWRVVIAMYWVWIVLVVSVLVMFGLYYKHDESSATVVIVEDEEDETSHLRPSDQE